MAIRSPPPFDQTQVSTHPVLQCHSIESYIFDANQSSFPHFFSLLFVLAAFKEDTTHLKALPGAPERLEIFDADLSRPDSFSAAIHGCVGVFHTAHPIIFDAQDPENMVIKPALEGTGGILRACLNSNTVKRVVYTSSASAVAFHAKKDLKEMDESVWTDVEFCRAQDIPISSYFISKTLTERAVLEFAAEYGMDVVTVLPSSVVGPFLVPHLPSSFSTSMALILGTYHDLGPVAPNLLDRTRPK